MTINATARITPRVTVYTAAAFSVCWALLRFIGHSVWRPGWGPPEAAVFVIEGMIAYGVAMVLCFQIAAEYRHSRWLRIAWLCLAVKSGIAVVRYALDDPMLNLIRPGYYESAWSGLARELPMMVAILFLVAGMLAMAYGFLQMGLGFRLERRDWVAIVALFAVIVAVMYFRQDLSAARWKTMPLVLQAQVATQILLAVAAALSILLYRLSLQMGGGQLAIAMRCLIAHIIVRALLVFVSMILLPGLFRIDRENVVTMFLYQGTPWLFTLAAVYRYQLAPNATRHVAAWRAREFAQKEPASQVEKSTSRIR
jgi:hypothetical protein